MKGLFNLLEKIDKDVFLRLALRYRNELKENKLIKQQEELNEKYRTNTSDDE